MAIYDHYSRTQTTDPGSRNGFPDGISQTVTSGGPFVPQTVAFNIVAGTGGTADDVALFAANLPTKMVLISVDFLPTVGAATSTVQIFTAVSGGGSALSSALASVTPGTIATSTGATAIATALAASTSMYLRRSNNTVAGVLRLNYIPTV